MEERRVEINTPAYKRRKRRRIQRHFEEMCQAAVAPQDPVAQEQVQEGPHPAPPLPALPEIDVVLENHRQEQEVSLATLINIVQNESILCAPGESNDSCLAQSTQESPFLGIVNSSMQLKARLISWKRENDISQLAFSKLLKIIKENTTEGKSFHSDSRAVMKTPRNLKIEKISGGEFYYFGIENQLKKLNTRLYKKCKFPMLNGISNLISITVGIDGLPIAKSSNACFWPILFKCNQLVESGVHVAGLYFGFEKPKNVNEYLEKFVKECQFLEVNGIELDGQHFNFRVACIVADCPARCMIKRCKYFTGHNSCERCTVVGKHIGRMVFLDMNEPLRSNVSFRNQSDPDHHEINSVTPLVEIKNLDLVYNIPLDMMHLILLGVVKKMLYNWVYGKHSYKWNVAKTLAVSRHFIWLKPKIPSEFARRPRPLKYLKNFKATEFKLFLLYTGVVVLKNVISQEEYKAFLMLNCAMRILLSNDANNVVWNSFANSLLRKFVLLCQHLYGDTFIVYNVHNVIHLSQDSLTYGSLDNCSAFDFENYMLTLKKYVKKGHQQLQQAVKRIVEGQLIRTCVRSKPCGFLQRSRFGKFKYNGVLYSVDSGNNVFCTEKREIVKIIKFIRKPNGNLPDVVCIKLPTSSLENYPCKSHKVGIFTAPKSFKTASLIRVNLMNLKYKCMLLPHNNEFLVLTLTKPINE